jgi:hypothetical protein
MSDARAQVYAQSIVFVILRDGIKTPGEHTLRNANRDSKKVDLRLINFTEEKNESKDFRR